MNLEKGAFGNPAEYQTLLLFWTIMENLHYRTIDVSTFKELARRWYPAVYLNRPPKNGGHRALADIIESLDELRYYRKAFMAPVPGPSEAEAKAIASEIQETSLLNKD